MTLRETRHVTVRFSKTLPVFHNPTCSVPILAVHVQKQQPEGKVDMPYRKWLLTTFVLSLILFLNIPLMQKIIFPK